MTSMTYWWHDRLSQGVRPEVPGFADLVGALDAMGNRLTAPPYDVPNVTCLIHPDDRARWLAIANQEKRRFMILVSSDPVGLPIQQPPGVFALKRPLPQVISLLNREPQRLERFKRSCEDGNPDIACFGHPPHEHLIAAYLIGLAKKNGSTLESKGLPLLLWKHAQTEYCVLGGDAKTAEMIEFATVSEVVSDIRDVLATVMED